MTLLWPNDPSAGVDKAKRPSMWIGHGGRLTAAAGIATITFQCHSDTWNEIRRLMSDCRRWEAPSTVRGSSDFMVEVQLSGPKAVAMLRGMRARATDFSGFDRAIARRVYIALAQVVDLVDVAFPRKALPPVVLDDVASGAGNDASRLDDSAPAGTC